MTTTPRAPIRSIVWTFEGALVRLGAGPVLPLRGAEEPLRDIPARLCPFGLVSSRATADVTAALERFGWAERFVVVVGADASTEGGDARDAEGRLRRAVEALGTAPSETLAVVGTPEDVAAARAIGAIVAALAGPSVLPALGRASFITSHPGAITDLWRGLR